MIPLLKNIESKIKLALTVSLASIIASIIIAATSMAYSFKMVNNSQKSIYVLSNNIPLQATRQEVANNRLVEYEGAIDYFHTLFFCLPPDDKFIQQQIGKAMYLVDKSGLMQFNALKEKGYFTNIVSSSATLTLITDSIHIEQETKTFKFYGTQKIERSSSVKLRSLVTTGNFRDVPRTVNNAHGVMITNWRTLENNDIKTYSKTIF